MAGRRGRASAAEDNAAPGTSRAIGRELRASGTNTVTAVAPITVG
jgi:hypothetical protein